MLGPKVALVTPSQERHTSNEAHQLFLGLQAGGYQLYGGGISTTDVREILKVEPSIVFVQDEHEWDSSHLPPDAKGHLALKEEYFHHVTDLAHRPDVLKLTVVKDTHRQYESAKQYSQAIGCHAWIVYYAPAIVYRTLNWLRPQHLIRTYHTLDAETVPPYSATDRMPCLLSGSLGGAYPLRTRIAEAKLPEVDFLRHPGYHNTGSHTPNYLKTLSRYKVSIATASRYGYALRKIIESTACGCRVITDLPVDEVLPDIDKNLVRVHPDISVLELRHLIWDLCHQYDPDFQEYMAHQAKARYDYRTMGSILVHDIERLRVGYSAQEGQ